MVWYSTLTVAAIIRASDGRWGQHVPSFNTANSLRGVYSLNTCLANRPTMGTRWHSRRVVRIRKRRTWSLCRKCQPIWTVYLWEREREAESITYIFIFLPKRKSILSYTEIGTLYRRIWPRFLFLLSVQKANAPLQPIILYIYVYWTVYVIQITEYNVF